MKKKIPLIVAISICLLIFILNYYIANILISNEISNFINIFFTFISISMTVFIFIVDKLENIINIDKKKNNKTTSKLEISVNNVKNELKKDILLIFFATIILVTLKTLNCNSNFFESIKLSIVVMNFLCMLDIILTFFRITEINKYFN